MPPSAMRSQAGGLPSGPRSRSIGPSSRQDNARRSDERDTETLPSPSRQVRPQRSMASFPRESSRTGAPPSRPTASPQSFRTTRHTSQSRSYDIRPESTRSRASEDSTASSSVSSIFDRVRAGAASYASSFTSIEDNNNTGDSEERPGRSLRKQRPLNSDTPSPQDLERIEAEPTDTGTGDGYMVWSRVATAASTLTVSVSKAWASNVTTFAGEETPPGQESRLIRAMKAYHIEKAREPTDLPAWLFEEHERQPRQPRRRATREQVDHDMVEMPPANAPPRRIRAFAESPSTSRLDRPITRGSDSDDTTQLKQTPKGTDRLKALRDARRAATDTTLLAREEPDTSQRGVRVGLPSGPAVRVRRN